MNKNGILFKVSGEYLCSNDGSNNFSQPETRKALERLIQFKKTIGRPAFMVIGGGNLCRGRELGAYKLKAGKADNVGMVSTIQNASLLSAVLEQLGQKTRVMGPSSMEWMGIDPFKADKARELAEEGIFVVFAGGLGLPRFTTDTASVMRAYQMECTTVVKFSEVGALYAEDPKKNPNAEIIRNISYSEVVEKKYEVMDRIAFMLAEEIQTIEIKILDLFIDEKYLTKDIIENLEVGSLISKVGTEVVVS